MVFLVSYYEEMVPKQKRLPNFDQIKFYKGRHTEFEIYPKIIYKSIIKPQRAPIKKNQSRIRKLYIENILS